MKSLGMTGSAPRKVKPGDFERALALMVEVGGDKGTKAYLAELVDAQAAHDKARADAEGAMAQAKQRESEAQKAEADATRARQAQVDETAKARDELGRREKAVSEREALAADVEAAQDVRDKELASREGHLREAGVQGF